MLSIDEHIARPATVGESNPAAIAERVIQTAVGGEANELRYVRELVEVGDRQGTALDYMAETLSSTGRPVTSEGVGLYWLGSVRAGVGQLVLCSRPLLPRFGIPSIRGLRLRAEEVQAIWLADTDLTWEDVDRRGEDPSPGLLAELGVDVSDDEVRMGALRLPLGTRRR